MLYESKTVSNSFQVFFSRDIVNGDNIWFSNNLIWCRECLACTNLDNQSYCIENVQYTKEEYLSRKQEYISQYLQKHGWVPVSYAYSLHVNCSQVRGIHQSLINCHDVENSILSLDVQWWRNIVMASSAETSQDFYDVFMGWRSQDFYAVCDSWWFCNNVYCSVNIGVYSSNIY